MSLLIVVPILFSILSSNGFAQEVKEKVLIISSKTNEPRHIYNSLNLLDGLNETGIYDFSLYLDLRGRDVKKMSREKLVPYDLDPTKLKGSKDLRPPKLDATGYQLIFLTGHGGLNSEFKDANIISEDDILNAFYFPSKKKFTGMQFLDVLNDWNDKGFRTLISTQCHSGSIHFLSAKLKNTCSVSSVPWWRISQTPDTGNDYNEGFMAEIANKKYDLNRDHKTNLLEAHLAGSFKAESNLGLSQLSSWAMLDFLLCGKGFKQVGENKVMTCKDETYLEKNGDLLTLKGTRIVDKSEEDYKFIPLSEDEQNSLPPHLKSFYKNLLSSGILSKKWPKNRRSSEYYSIYAYLQFLKKYILAKGKFGEEDMGLIDSLIECEALTNLD